MKSALQKIPLKLLIRQPVMFDANIFMVGIEKKYLILIVLLKICIRYI